MDAKKIKKFRKYAKGYWTLQKPTKIGLYSTKTLTGLEGPDIIIYQDIKTGQLTLSHEWKEFFWSEPDPD